MRLNDLWACARPDKALLDTATCSTTNGSFLSYRTMRYSFEIGGLNGASLRMWHDYLSAAQIVCLDINRQ